MKFNEQIFNILTEAAKSKTECVNKGECGEACEDFESLIGNDGNFSKAIVPNNLKFSADEVPICKAECGGSKCEDDEEECCKEGYFIDGRILDIYMYDNGIENDADAVYDICEHYGIDVDDVYVVTESDETCKCLVDHSKKYISYGLLKRCGNQIQNCINAGIKVVKRS